MKIIFLFISLFFSFGAAGSASSSWVGELQFAQRFLDQKKYIEAHDQYLRYAKKNGLAQLALGIINANGLGRARNAEQACFWFKKSAENNVPVAEHFWANCLVENKKNPENIRLAVGFYERAASHGHLISSCYAADYYMQGFGVTKDVQKALSMCSEVANVGSLPAIKKMARYYSDNRYIPIDVPAAEYWYQRGAEIGSAEMLSDWASFVASVSGMDSPRAVYLAELAAAQGYAPSYLMAAVFYAHSTGREDGDISPEHLAKIYLWSRAAKAACEGLKDSELLAQIDRLLIEMIPQTWYADLDEKVAGHLLKYPVGQKMVCSK